MANYTTKAQRVNARQDKIYAKAMAALRLATQERVAMEQRMVAAHKAGRAWSQANATGDNPPVTTSRLKMWAQTDYSFPAEREAFVAGFRGENHRRRMALHKGFLR